MQISAIKSPGELGGLVGQPGETLTATLKRTITEMVLFGYFADVTRLYPQELARRFAVSQTPVREALMQLASEGLIEATPRRGYRIKTPTPGEVVDLWQVRKALEIAAAEALVARLRDGSLSDADLADMEAVQRRRDALGARMSSKEHIETNSAFHRALVELSGNRLLAALFASIQSQLIGAWVQRGLDSWRARLAEDSVEHRGVLAALKSRDASRCRAVLEKHVGRSLYGALDDLKARRETESPAARRTAISQ